MTINPYLGFNGNCEEALKFYETTLGGKILTVFRYESSPMAASALPVRSIKSCTRVCNLRTPC